DYAFPEERGITIARDSSGGMTIRLGAPRRPMTALVQAFFCIVVMVLTVSAAALSYSVFLIIPLALIELLFVIGLCRSLFLIVMLRISRHDLTVTRSMLRTRAERYTPENIHAIDAESSGSAGNSQFYKLMLTTNDGKSHTLAAGL